MVSSPKANKVGYFLSEGEDTMTNIVAEVSQEVQEIFQDLTGNASVSIADIEERVSAAVDSWGQRLSEAILSETASSTEASPASVSCPSCQGRSRRYGCRIQP